MATLRFLGATGTVTGSRYLVEHEGMRVLVDCGLFQGYKQLRLRNWGNFPVPPDSIDAVILTHAHLDHSGYLPRLVRKGFRGRIYCTPPTEALSEVLLADSGRLQEEEAGYASRKKSSRHAQPLPLYSEADAKACMASFTARETGAEFALGRDLSFSLLPAGHLLGAAQVRMRVGRKVLHFSGDIGRDNDLLMPPPAPLGEVDALVCEATYGNRQHPAVDVADEIAAVVQRVAARGGVIVIPAFAVGRTQELLVHLDRLRRNGAIPALPVFVNSPMAQAATEVHRRFCGGLRLSAEECQRISEFATPTRTVEESKALNGLQGPAIIISASGMLTGGRVLHHVAAYGPDRRNAIVLAGFQAAGTRGARLAAGERSLRIFGTDVPINAEVVNLQGLSAHADRDGVLRWVQRAARPPGMVYVTHGEPEAADALRYSLEHQLGIPARVPEHLETVSIEHPAEVDAG
ncbi:MAG TPA: MBL fold metallo-hydrolase [Steroidobacteraceae bacterium]|nr:MBL fold metallo-hydrolase [Steroidobacteraceae bacterium]